MAMRELDQLLEVTNTRRRARGLPERTREEVQREFGRRGGSDRVARVLIIGCGCRGRRLAVELRERGHVIRAPPAAERLAAIEAAGAEAVLADPDRLATLVAALDHVTVAVLLLGSATGEPAQLFGTARPSVRGTAREAA